MQGFIICWEDIMGRTTLLEQKKPVCAWNTLKFTDTACSFIMLDYDSVQWTVIQQIWLEGNWAFNSWMFYSLVETTEMDLFKDILIALADNTTYSFTIWSVNIYGQRGASSPPMFYEIHECESKADKDSACNGKRYIYIKYKWRLTMLC